MYHHPDSCPYRFGEKITYVYERPLFTDQREENLEKVHSRSNRQATFRYNYTRLTLRTSEYSDYV